MKEYTSNARIVIKESELTFTYWAARHFLQNVVDAMLRIYLIGLELMLSLREIVLTQYIKL